MLKYIGALVVFVSCTLSGLTLCEREKLKLRQCEAFLSLFEYVKKYINNFPLLPTKRRIILHQAPLLSSYWLSHKDVPYLVFVQNPVHTPHLIHL